MSTSSLGFRLGFALAFALLPLGVLSIVQAQSAQNALAESTLEGVSGASVQAARGQIDLIREAQVAARTFAASISIALSEGITCVEQSKAVARSIPQATLVTYIPLSGLMTCSSNDRVYDFSDNPLFQQMTSRPLPMAVYNPMGPLSGTAIVGVAHPVFDRRGKQLGVVSISLPYYALTPDSFNEDVAGWRPGYLVTVTIDGDVLISSEPERDPAIVLPPGLSIEDLPERAGQAWFETGPAGRKILSVTAVTKGLFLVSVWRPAATSVLDMNAALVPYLLPGLTWIAALVVAAFASSRLVVRHVRALSLSMVDYLSTKSRVIVPDVANAPSEIQRLHSAYQALVQTIEQEEAELQNLLIDKDTLLREVNHRSGNSLQIIASVMRMYRRETRDPVLQRVLDGLNNRVLALSSTHTSLYNLSGQRDVPLDEVLFSVISRLKQIHRVQIGTVEAQLQPMRTDTQTATGVALATAEAVNSFFAVPRLSKGQVTISLTGGDGTARLTISGPAVPEFHAGLTEGIATLPRRMLHQFARQLRGTLTITEAKDVARLELTFPLIA